MKYKINNTLINKQKGFMALFSITIISFILIMISTNLSFFNFYTRFNILDSESKIKSRSLAESCLELARLSLAYDNNYSVNNIIINIEKNSCNYSIENILPYPIIISHSVINRSHTYLKTHVDKNKSNIPIIFFEEISNYK